MKNPPRSVDDGRASGEMRGTPPKQRSMLALVSMESLVPISHPLRAVKRLVDEVLAELDPRSSLACTPLVGGRRWPPSGS